MSTTELTRLREDARRTDRFDNTAALDRYAAAVREDERGRMIEEQTTVQPEPPHRTLHRYFSDMEKLTCDFRLRAMRQPDGGFHFYIHPAAVSGDTEDFLIWPDPFNHLDMIANRQTIPPPDVEGFIAHLRQRGVPATKETHP